MCTFEMASELDRVLFQEDHLHGVLNSSAIMVSNDMVFCDECDKYDVQQSLNTTKHNKTVPDNYKV